MFSKLFFCAITLQVALSRPQDSEDEGRIVGGTPVTIENYPYQVGVRFPDLSHPGYSNKCSGGLILENLVLTAAHCTEFSPAERAGGKVHVGSADFSYGGEFINIIQIVDHPSYGGRAANWDNDISVLKLEHSVKLSSTVQLVLIASYPRKTGVITKVAGWGRTVANDPKSHSEELLGIDMEFIDSNDCRTQSFHGNAITPNMVCGGDLHNRFASTCKGDSGGPMVHDGEAIGIVSWGIGDCGAQGYPRVLTNVYNYRFWINDQKDLLSS